MYTSCISLFEHNITLSVRITTIIVSYNPLTSLRIKKKLLKSFVITHVGTNNFDDINKT